MILNCKGFSHACRQPEDKYPVALTGSVMITSSIEVCTDCSYGHYGSLLNSRSRPSRWLSISPPGHISNSGANTLSSPDKHTINILFFNSLHLEIHRFE